MCSLLVVAMRCWCMHMAALTGQRDVHAGATTVHRIPASTAEYLLDRLHCSWVILASDWARQARAVCQPAADPPGLRHVTLHKLQGAFFLSRYRLGALK